MKRSPIKRRSAIKRGVKRVNPVNRSRRDREYERTYGSVERVAWVKTQRCVISGELADDIDNMHAKGDGAGRKADYIWIVPARRKFHREAHRIGVKSFQAKYGVDLIQLAEETQRQWLLHLLEREPLCAQCEASVVVAPSRYCAACQYERDGGDFAAEPPCDYPAAS